MLTKNSLNIIFESARSENARFVFIKIDVDNTEEVIVIPTESFDKKQEFYNKAYTDNLIHVMNKNVQITGLSYGEPDVIDELFSKEEV